MKVMLPVCPDCATLLTYISHKNEWHCFECQRKVDVPQFVLVNATKT